MPLRRPWGSLVGARLAPRLGVWTTIVLALTVAGLVSLPQAGVSSVAELFGLRLIVAFALGMVIPVANLAVRSSVPPERQGAAFGVAASATSAAFGIGPLGGGFLAATFGFGAPFVAPGVLLLVAALVLTAFSLTTSPRYLRLLKHTLVSLIS